MDFKTTAFVALSLIAGFGGALCADSGRQSTRQSPSSKSPVSVELDRKRLANQQNVANRRQYENHSLAQNEAITTLNNRTIWFRNLAIFSIFLAAGFGLLAHSLWCRSRLQSITIELEEKKLQSNELRERIAQLQRVKSLGMLASGVAHDFNNLLVGVLCNAELLEMDFNKKSSNGQSLERIEQIIESAEKAADLSRQMLAYAGKTQIIKVPAELNTLVSRLESLLITTTGQDNQLELDLSPDPSVANIDSTQIEQILLNLVSNARQASSVGGEIIIRTGSEFIESIEADPHLFGSRETGGQFVFLEVQDWGAGIPEENIQRIFDPFFTDREDGRGLGLAVVYGFVKSHDGLIRATTTHGEGTCFRILLPSSDEIPPTVEHIASSPDELVPTPKDVTVLVVDDEPAVRESASALLSTLGWTAHFAKNGIKAIDFLREHPDSVDCVLLDVVMPEMGAREVLAEMRAEEIQPCVVLMSGHSEEQLEHYRQTDNVAAILSKPFKTQELVRTISTAIDKSRAHK
jgi:signal transduction histidine kinase